MEDFSIYSYFDYLSLFLFRKRLRKDVREMNAAFRKEMAELDELENMDDDLGKSKQCCIIN